MSIPRRGPKHDHVRSSRFSLCHDACGALESWKARQLHLKPTTTRQQGTIRACTARSLSRPGAEDSDLPGFDCLHSHRSALASNTAGSACSYRATVLSFSFLFDACILSRRYRGYICIHHRAHQSSIRKRRTIAFPHCPALTLSISYRHCPILSQANEITASSTYYLNKFSGRSPMDRRGR